MASAADGGAAPTLLHTDRLWSSSAPGYLRRQLRLETHAIVSVAGTHDMQWCSASDAKLFQILFTERSQRGHFNRQSGGKPLQPHQRQERRNSLRDSLSTLARSDCVACHEAPHLRLIRLARATLPVPQPYIGRHSFLLSGNALHAHTVSARPNWI